MPELPEVETVRRILQNQIVGLTFKNVNVVYKRLIQTDLKEFEDVIKDKTILDINRKGKFLIINLSSSYSLLVHFRMEGKLFHITSENIDQIKDKHVTCYFEFTDSSYLVFNDVRKFGVMCLYKTNELYMLSPLKNLGKEPWDITDHSYLLRQFKDKNYTLKEGLLDQSVVAGLGNIYADEVLYKSRLNPFMKAKDLTLKQASKIIINSRDILDQAILNKGSTIISYHPSLNQTGNMQNFLKVYGKKGEKCPICHSTFEKRFVNGRGTTYCYKCQNVSPSVAVTGKIASGKSLVLSIFNKKGFATSSADEIVHKLYVDKTFLKNTQKIFPDVFTNSNLDKKKVINKMLEDKSFRRKYQNYVWSKVGEEINKFIIENTSKPQIIEVPLLFEAKMENDFTYIIGVETSKQVEYLKIRNDDDPQKRLKMNSINSYDNNKDKLDFVIVNDGEISHVEKKVDEIIKKISKTKLYL
jgi:formamidopyrimidine-DNA glycosylase